MFRRIPLFALAAAFAALALVGCGGEGDSGGDGLETALSYLPSDVTTVVVLTTDLGSEAYREAGETLVPRLYADEEIDGEAPRSFEDVLRRAVDSGTDLSYDVEVEPLLGEPLVLGTSDPEGLVSDGFLDPDLVLALDTGDGDAARDLLEGFPGIEPVGEELGADLYGTSPGG